MYLKLKMLRLKPINLKIKLELTVFHLIKQRNKYNVSINMFLIQTGFMIKIPE